jgi:hypothetical protein
MGAGDETVILENFVVTKAAKQASGGIVEKLRQANQLYDLGHKDEAKQAYDELEKKIWEMPKGRIEYACALECCATLVRMGHEQDDYQILFAEYAEEAVKTSRLSPQEIENIRYRQVKSRRFSLMP